LCDSFEMPGGSIVERVRSLEHSGGVDLTGKRVLDHGA
jgi:hypothetical protein